ncbi:MAG: rRNA methyltransferase [Methylibium sp. NZG]|nr:MAG: rRNA methyltransferase [Methylibium sp. NZG]
MPEPRHIASRDNALLVKLRKLVADPAGYRKMGQVWIEGEHLCAAWQQRGGAVLQAVLTDAAWDDPGLRELTARADATAVISPSLMAGISTLESSPPIAFCVSWPGAGELQAGVASIVLDRLQDAGNVGNLLRSAAAFGVGQVVALKGTVALWSSKVLRAGMGAHFGLHLVEAVDEAALEGLGVPLLAGSSHAAQAIHQVALPWPCAWVLGHEGQGVSPALMSRCAQVLRIPQPGGEESLNVAAAAAVCLYESARQRGAV